MRPERLLECSGIRSTGEIGALTSSLSADGVVTNHYFDALGRPARNCWTIQGIEDCIAQAYGPGTTAAAGLPVEVTYPNRPWQSGQTQPLRATIGYATTDSSLASVTNASTGHEYWRATSRSPDGLVTGARVGGLDEVRQFDALTRRIKELSVKSGATDRMRLRYTYRPNGNVETRQDVTGAFTDTFDYDRLNQLMSWTATGSRQLTERYDYDRLGNILGTRNAQNQVVDAYDLARTDNAGPLAVTRFAEGATGEVFTYKHDQAKRQRERRRNGQLWQTVGYTPFDLPRSLTTRSGGIDVTTAFLYDAFQTRVFKGNATDSTTYVGGLYERRVRTVQGGSTTTHVYHVSAESSVVAQVEYVESTAAHQTYQVHADPLGSAGVVTNSAGAIVQELYYSPFGRRISRAGAFATSSPSSVRTGFTGHEHDDELALVNMRGRMYDPRLRRFTTPDPVAFEHPYAYVNNNPLRYVDPSGFNGENYVETGSGSSEGWGGYIFGLPPQAGSQASQGSPQDRYTTSSAAQFAAQAGVAGGAPNAGGGYQPNYGSYSGGSATGAGSQGPTFGKGPPGSPSSEAAQVWQSAEGQHQTGGGAPVRRGIATAAVAPAVAPVAVAPILSAALGGLAIGKIADEVRKNSINLDAGALINLTTADPRSYAFYFSIITKNWVTTHLAVAELMRGARRMGKTEMLKTAIVLRRVTLVPTIPSLQAMRLRPTLGIGIEDILIFGTGDALRIPTYTTDGRAVRAAKAQGVFFDTVELPSLSHTGR